MTSYVPGVLYTLIHLLLAVVFVHIAPEPMTTFVTGSQLMAHVVGDYVLQSHWMAVEKGRGWGAAVLHGLSYMVPFLLLTHSPLALLVISASHVVVDRYRLAKYVVWARNTLGGFHSPWEECSTTGMPMEVPAYLSAWLMIIVDNVIHVLINAAAIRWL